MGVTYAARCIVANVGGTGIDEPLHGARRKASPYGLLKDVVPHPIDAKGCSASSYR